MCTTKDRKERTDDEQQDDDHRASSELLQRSPCSSHLLRDRILCGFAVRDNDEWGNGVTGEDQKIIFSSRRHLICCCTRPERTTKEWEEGCWLLAEWFASHFLMQANNLLLLGELYFIIRAKKMLKKRDLQMAMTTPSERLNRRISIMTCVWTLECHFSSWVGGWTGGSAHTFIQLLLPFSLSLSSCWLFWRSCNVNC